MWPDVIHCRIQPYMNQVRRRRPGVSAALSLRRPARRTPGHARRAHRSGRLIGVRAGGCTLPSRSAIKWQLAATASMVALRVVARDRLRRLLAGGHSHGFGACGESGAEEVEPVPRGTQGSQYWLPGRSANVRNPRSAAVTRAECGTAPVQPSSWRSSLEPTKITVKSARHTRPSDGAPRHSGL